MTLMMVGFGCGGEAPTINRPEKAVWCPQNVPPSQAFDARVLLGLSPDAAREHPEIKGRRCAFRVVMLDGKPQPGTADVRQDRVEAVVEDSVVVEVSIG